MVGKEKIVEILNEILSEDMFLVDVTISKSNTICIYIDSFRGLSIEDCTSVSKQVESKLDRDSGDFELEVSSPGIGQPFRIKQQFIKNTGREIELLTTEGMRLKGKLENADDQGIALLIRVKEKTEGGKKQEITKRILFGYDSIKAANAIVTFK